MLHPLQIIQWILEGEPRKKKVICCYCSCGSHCHYTIVLLCFPNSALGAGRSQPFFFFKSGTCAKMYKSFSAISSRFETSRSSSKYAQASTSPSQRQLHGLLEEAVELGFLGSRKDIGVSSTYFYFFGHYIFLMKNEWVFLDK